MRRFVCNLQMTVTFKDDAVEESDAEDLITAALKRLKPVDLNFDSVEEVEIEDESDEDSEESDLGLLEDGEDFDEDDE